jgi:hypothetical protein
MAELKDNLGFDSLHKSLDRFKKDIKFALYVSAFWNTLATILTIALIFKCMVFK